MLACSSDAERMADLQQHVKQHFEAEGFTVVEIKFSDKSKRTLSGYARLRKSVPPLGDMDFTRLCTATLDESSSRYTWTCNDR
jgi:uncharacterized protein YkuJ